MEKEPKAKFQHLRKDNGNLYATVCTITDDTKQATGIAILGDCENFNRKIGKHKALGRARRAWYTGKKDFPIYQTERENLTYFVKNVFKAESPIGCFKSFRIDL